MAIKKLKDFTNANNEILVDAAIKDSMGRNIADTYATKEEASQGGGSGTTESSFNVINASDINVSDLTESNITILTNGNPTLIKGDILGYHNPVLFPNLNVGGGTNYYGFIIGWASTSGTYAGYLQAYVILTSTSPKRMQLDQTGRLETFLKSINGKQIPAYPTTNASPQFLQIGANGGSLSWANVDYCNITVSLEANSGSNIGNEIAFTFVGKKSIYENYDATNLLEIIYNRISDFSLYETPFTDSSTTEFFKFSNITKSGTVYGIELVDASQNTYTYEFDTDSNIPLSLTFWG